MDWLYQLFSWVMSIGCSTDAFCNTSLIDRFFLDMCDTVEYCITKTIDKGTEYVILAGDKTYVMIYK